MSRAAAFRERASVVFVRLGVLAVALVWMWFNAQLVQELGTESLGRSGWVGVPGTVVVSRCTSEIIDQETATEWTDCVGYFTPAEPSLPDRTVGMSNTGGAIAPGSTVEVRLVNGVAFERSLFRAGMSGTGALLFGLLGGVPIAAAVMVPYGLTARAERSPLRPGVQAGVFAVIAVVGQLLLTLLLDRWSVI
ncbi:hypothetical protein [Catellatospora citrea]|uniref:Uncharacterized protein n=1 Tax=Catellatospora citrea TaxID=53366 RepID=A0A8J3K9J4_9ACTN|nr:hypothetical protein [Catellatospora citrea]RKE11164.1 hypothetical protein C8E86_6088 [Catellatospora citrea]GIF96629.1 hypothetical protein Cci01nite_17230 [Catellatospora citrea]